ncbi:hypothetical protein D3C80_1616230 [compost metagenome]
MTQVDLLVGLFQPRGQIFGIDDHARFHVLGWPGLAGVFDYHERTASLQQRGIIIEGILGIEAKGRVHHQDLVLSLAVLGYHLELLFANQITGGIVRVYQEQGIERKTF